MIIPFDIDEYRKIQLNYDGFPSDDYFYSEDYAKLNSYGKVAAQDHVYHHKNLYLMNNNGARNFALREGKKHARWVFPLDGNSFITEESWAALDECMNDASNHTVINIPMVRLVDNYDVLQKSYYPTVIEEPQLAFKHTSNVTFNPNMRYGRRSKVELLWRLRIPGPWDKNKRFFPWEAESVRQFDEPEKFLTCSWVARLFSGRQEQEWKDASSTRNQHRLQGIRNLIDGIDQSIMRANLEDHSLIMIPKFLLDHLRKMLQETGLLSEVAGLWINVAVDRILHNPFDSYSRLNEIESVDKTRALMLLKKFQQRIFLDSVIAHISDNDMVAYESYQLVWAFLLNPSAYQQGSSNFFDYILAEKGINLANINDFIDAVDFPLIFDAILLLEDAGILSYYDLAALKKWASENTKRITRIEFSRATKEQRNYRDVQIASNCLFAEDLICAYHAISRFKHRLTKNLETSEKFTILIGAAIQSQLGISSFNLKIINEANISENTLSIFQSHFQNFMLELLHQTSTSGKITALENLIRKLSYFDDAQVRYIVENFI